jgi:hypothetical protein
LNNGNVKLALAFSALDGTANGIWGYSALNEYINLTTGSKFKVGLAEGIQGIAQALAAIPAGIGADNSRRDRVLVWAGGVGILASGVSVGALLLGSDDDTILFGSICVALLLWGAYSGIWNTSLESIFADSVETGSRTWLYTLKFIVSIAANALGPLINIVVFRFFVADQWSIADLKPVLMTGFLFSIVPSTLLFFFSDERSLGGASEAVKVGNANDDEGSTSSLLVSGESEAVQAVNSRRRPLLETSHYCVKHRHIPFILALSDCLFGLASGSKL